jgi:hypothetical protein
MTSEERVAEKEALARAAASKLETIRAARGKVPASSSSSTSSGSIGEAARATEQAMATLNTIEKRRQDAKGRLRAREEEHQKELQSLKDQEFNAVALAKSAYNGVNPHSQLTGEEAVELLISQKSETLVRRRGAFDSALARSVATGSAYPQGEADRLLSERVALSAIQNWYTDKIKGRPWYSVSSHYAHYTAKDALERSDLLKMVTLTPVQAAVRRAAYNTAIASFERGLEVAVDKFVTTISDPIDFTADDLRQTIKRASTTAKVLELYSDLRQSASPDAEDRSTKFVARGSTAFAAKQRSVASSAEYDAKKIQLAQDARYFNTFVEDQKRRGSNLASPSLAQSKEKLANKWANAQADLFMLEAQARADKWFYDAIDPNGEPAVDKTLKALVVAAHEKEHGLGDLINKVEIERKTALDAEKEKQQRKAEKAQQLTSKPDEPGGTL